MLDGEAFFGESYIWLSWISMIQAADVVVSRAVVCAVFLRFESLKGLGRPQKEASESEEQKRGA